MRGVLTLVVLLVALVAPAAADPCRGAPASPACPEQGLPAAVGLDRAVEPPPPLAAPLPVASRPDESPSLVGAVLRLVGAVVLLALLMLAAVVGYRRVAQRVGAPPAGVLAWVTGAGDERGADAIRIGSRRYLSGRDSLAVVHAGGERFLVGITAAGISLLARLETPTPGLEPPAVDFTEALARAAGPTLPGPDAAPAADRALRTAVERSRERLARLTHLSVVPRDPRG